VAGAARGLAEGIAASAVPSDGTASAAVPLAAATGEDADSPTAQVTQSDPLAGAREELRQLGDEVHAAIAQARGLIAFAAQMARARRHHDEDFYRGLQSDVTDAGHDVDAALNAAGRTLDSSQTGAVGGVSAIETTTTIIQVTTEVTVTANIVV